MKDMLLVALLIINSILIGMLIDYYIDIRFTGFDPLNDIEMAEAISTRLAEEYDYDVDDFNCQNFSKKFDVVAEELGIDSTVWRGTNANKTSGHAWNKVCVDLEPNGNGVVDYSKEYPYQNQRFKELDDK